MSRNRSNKMLPFMITPDSDAFAAGKLAERREAMKRSPEPEERILSGVVPPRLRSAIPQILSVCKSNAESLIFRPNADILRELSRAFEAHSKLQLNIGTEEKPDIVSIYYLGNVESIGDDVIAIVPYSVASEEWAVWAAQNATLYPQEEAAA